MKYLTVADVANAANVKEAVVRYNLRKGWIGASRIGTRIMFTERQAEFVVTWLQEQQTKHGG